MNLSNSSNMLKTRTIPWLFLALLFLSTIPYSGHAAFEEGQGQAVAPCGRWLNSSQVTFNDEIHKKRWLIAGASRAKDLRDYAQATVYLEELLALDPSDPLTHSQLALSYRANRDFEKALVHALETERLEGATAKNLMCIVQIYLLLGDEAKADEILGRALERYPRDIIFLAMKAQSFLRDGHNDRALVVANYILKLSPRDRVGAKLKLLAESGPVPEDKLSLENYREAMTYLERGELRIAEGLFSRAAQTPEVVWRRTMINFNLRRYADARALLEPQIRNPSLDQNLWVLVALLKIENMGKLPPGSVTELVRKTTAPEHFKQIEQMAKQLEWEFIGGSVFAEISLPGKS